MSSLVNFKDALQIKLIEDNDLLEALGDAVVDIRTGQKNITIAEVSPNTADQVPFLGYSVPKTKPITKDDTSGCFVSTVIFHIVTTTSEKTTYIADRVQLLITQRPLGETQKWFFDVTNECIFSKYSKFVGRYPLSPRRFNNETDVFTELIETEFIWCYCPCAEVTCNNPIPEDCELIIDAYDIDCECDE